MSALRDPRFRRLLVGQSLSNFGDSALYLSLAIWAKDLTGSNGAAGLVFASLGAASLFAPLGGYLVDRAVHRRRLLMATDAVTALVVCVLLLVDSRGELWILYAVAAAYGLSANIIGPATTALLKDMLDDDDLGSSNALRQTLGQGLRLLSPLVGAGLYAGVGSSALVLFDAATFVASIAAVASVAVNETPPAAATDRRPFREEIRAGFAYLLAQPVLRGLCAVSAVAMLTIGFYESLDFAVIAELGKQPSFFGVLMSVQATGSILGGIIVVKVMRRLGETRTVALGLACFAVGSAGLTVNTLAFAFAAVAVLGAGISLFAVGLYTAQQRLTPPRLQGRVSAASFVVTDIPQTLSIGLGAVLITAIDYRALLAVLVVVTAGCALSLIPSHRSEQFTAAESPVARGPATTGVARPVRGSGGQRVAERSEKS